MLLGYTKDATPRIVLRRHSMLVVISDLHLTDGTTGSTIAADAFEIFSERVRDMAYQASWRTEGTYRPIEEIHLVLLGDIFDHLLSTQWLEEPEGKRVHPWDDLHSEAFIRKIESINRAILAKNAEAFRVLHAMSTGDKITLPPATKRGRPAFNTRRIPVPVRIHYMVGNHDWYFHVPGAPWDAIRGAVVDALGLQNPSTPFPHTLEEALPLRDVCRRHRLYLRHGDIYDGFNYDKERGRNAATLGDAIVVELVNKFPVEIERRFGDTLPVEFREGLREIANVRPNLLVPVWIAALMRRTCTPAQREAIKEVWDELAAAFSRNPFVRQFDTPYFADRVDFIQGVLFISRLTSMRRFSEIARTFYKKFWDGETSLARHALQEKAVLNAEADYVVYGHTHQPEIVPLDVYETGRDALSQVYFNSGTWHAIHDMVLRETEYPKFIPHHTMTFLAFFRGDERKGRPYETWTGGLGWKD